MKRPFRFLAIVGLLILSLVAAWRGGLLPGVAPPWHDDLRILREARDDTDVMVSLVENGDEDWSFAHGRAQFLTGEL